MRKVTPGGMPMAKRIQKKISPVRDACGAPSHSRLSLRLTDYGYFSLIPELRDSSRPTLPACLTAKAGIFFRPSHYPDFIRISERSNLHSYGLFLSIPESKQNLREKEKFRACEEITPSKLGFVKMMGEDKNQPCPDHSGLLRFCFKDKNEGPRQGKSIIKIHDFF